MALSLRRANAVKDAWSARVCRPRRSPSSQGEPGLLVQTATAARAAEPPQTRSSSSDETAAQRDPASFASANREKKLAASLARKQRIVP